MDEIIKKIIEVENHAKSMTEQSKNGMETAKKVIKNNIARMEEEYKAASKELIELAQQDEAEKVKAEKSDIEKSFKEANAKLDAAYKSGKDGWISQIVQQTLSD